MFEAFLLFGKSVFDILFYCVSPWHLWHKWHKGALFFKVALLEPEYWHH